MPQDLPRPFPRFLEALSYFGTEPALCPAEAGAMIARSRFTRDNDGEHPPMCAPGRRHLTTPTRHAMLCFIGCWVERSHQAAMIFNATGPKNALPFNGLSPK